MIRVLITGPAHEGRFPYRIETVGTRLATPYVGLDANPLYHACHKLQEWRAADDNASIGLFQRSGNPPELEGIMLGDTPFYLDMGRLVRQTTVGYGAAIGAQPSTPEGSPPPQQKSPAPRDETDLAATLSGTSGQSHHKRKPIGSGARRGQR